MQKSKILRLCFEKCVINLHPLTAQVQNQELRNKLQKFTPHLASSVCAEVTTQLAVDCFNSSKKKAMGELGVPFGDKGAKTTNRANAPLIVKKLAKHNFHPRAIFGSTILELKATVAVKVEARSGAGTEPAGTEPGARTDLGADTGYRWAVVGRVGNRGGELIELGNLV